VCGQLLLRGAYPEPNSDGEPNTDLYRHGDTHGDRFADAQRNPNPDRHLASLLGGDGLRGERIVCRFVLRQSHPDRDEHRNHYQYTERDVDLDMDQDIDAHPDRDADADRHSGRVHADPDGDADDLYAVFHV
jgi:hypothetical protein